MSENPIWSRSSRRSSVPAIGAIQSPIEDSSRRRARVWSVTKWGESNASSPSSALPWDADRLIERPSGVRFEEAVTVGAMSYDLARIGGARPGGPGSALLRPMSAGAYRVLAILTGVWLDQGGLGCRPNVGTHLDDCPHRATSFRTSRRELARLAFAHDGGRQVRQVDRALDELGERGRTVILFDPDSAPRTVTSMAIVAVETTRRARTWRGVGDEAVDATLTVRWAPEIQNALLLGRFQRLPIDVVQGLTGSAWYLWMRVLTHPRTSQLGPGESFEIAVSGYAPSLPASALGLDRVNRPSKLRRSLEAAAAAGNAIQDRLTVSVLDRSSRGLKIKVRRRSEARRGRDRGTPESSSRYTADGSEPTDRRPDGFLDENQDVPVSESKNEGRPVRLADGLNSLMEPDGTVRHRQFSIGDSTTWDLAAGWTAQQRADAVEELLLASPLAWKRSSPRQRGRLEAVEHRANRIDCPLAEHLEIVQEGIDSYVAYFVDREHSQYRDDDPLGDLFHHDDVMHRRRPRSPRTTQEPDTDMLARAWRASEPLTEFSRSELMELGATPALEPQGGLVAVANILAGVEGRTAAETLTSCRRAVHELVEVLEDDAV